MRGEDGFVVAGQRASTLLPELTGQCDRKPGVSESDRIGKGDG